MKFIDPLEFNESNEFNYLFTSALTIKFIGFIKFSVSMKASIQFGGKPIENIQNQSPPGI